MTALPAAARTSETKSFAPEACVLLKLGEIVLKGRNRQQFERLLQHNIRLAAADLGVGLRLWQRDGVFVLTSAELAIAIGSRVQRLYGNPVNLSEPDFSIHVEVDQSEVFVYTDGSAGQGGLPVGMSGRGLVLMSGGIDSPVAGYRMMRRGLYCSFLHFSGMPLTGPESVYKA